jgi:hypothetical protein
MVVDRDNFKNLDFARPSNVVNANNVNINKKYPKKYYYGHLLKSTPYTKRLKP